MSKAKTKILLLGASGYDANNEEQMLRSVGWSGKSFPNPRDFDIVVVSLLDIDLASVDWRKFHEVFYPKATRDILFNAGKIVVLGDPRFFIPPLDDNGIPGMKHPFLDWTGLDFVWDSQTGDTMTFSKENRHECYREYFKQMRQWKYSLASCTHKSQYTRKRYSENESYEQLTIDSWLTNRYQHQIAFDAILLYGKDTYSFHHRTEVFHPSKGGRIVFLPPLEIPSDEAIRMVLRDVCGFEAEISEPKWVLGMLAPGQQAIDEKILSVSTEIEKLQNSLAELNAEREQKRICLKLLYERELVLEPIVLDILTHLGAEVEEPLEKNKEDGWITVKLSDAQFEGVLEIKSTKKDHFTEEGRKQVVDWVQKGIAEREKKYKGIFIGNNAVNKPIDARPYPFPESWSKAARLSEICAFTTAQLFQAYSLDRQSKLDRNAFWRAVFECNGVCSFAGIL